MHAVSVIRDRIEEWLSEDLFVVDVALTGPRNQQKLRVLLDGDKGVTIDQCAELSRKLSAWLDDTDLFPGSYQLEVSSPGVDQPLKLKRQYYKNIGRQVKVLLVDGRELKGMLEAVTDGDIVVKVVQKKEESMNNIHFQDIQHIKVLVTF